MTTNTFKQSDVWPRLRRSASNGWTAFRQWTANTANTTSKRTAELWRRWRCSPRVDLFETERTLELRADFPGVNADAIDIKFRGHRLTISGERPAECGDDRTCRLHERATGRLTRSITLPCNVREEKADTQYRNGVVMISLPKKGNEVHVHIKSDSKSNASCCQTDELPWAI